MGREEVPPPVAIEVLGSCSLAAFARYDGHPTVIRRPGARTHGRHPRRLRKWSSRESSTIR